MSMSTSTSKPNLTIQPSDEEDEEDYLHWVRQYVERPGHEFFCLVDTDFIMDRFNLTNLGRSVPNAEAGYENLLRGSSDSDTISDSSDSSDDEGSPQLEVATTLIFGLLHQRFIITPFGLSAMKKKYLRGDFGRCPRYMCEGQHVLPIGLSDTPRRSSVKLYCPRCQDIYQPRTTIHTAIDGAFFGTSFPQVFLMHYKMEVKPVPADLHRHPSFSHTLNPLRMVHGKPVKTMTGSDTCSSEASEDDFDDVTDDEA